MPKPAMLERRLGLPEALGISIAIISPSIGMSFNLVLVAQMAGAAVPLAFILGTAVMLVVALSFVAFSRRQAHAGAAYAFIADAFGARAGVLAGWSMILVYICFGSGLALLVGSFLTTAIAEVGPRLDFLVVPIAISVTLLGAFLAWRDVRLASRLMLALEGVSISAILVLAAQIYGELSRHGGWSWAPFSARSSAGGWLGVGFGMVFAVLSFAGFEAAATLGEETLTPKRTIPVALVGSVAGVGLFYAIVSYAVVMGYGVHRATDLAHAAAPLDELARTRIGPAFAVLVDLCCAISAFSGVLGSLSGAIRVVFALGRGGMSRAMARIDPVHHTPSGAVIVCTLACIVPMLLMARGLSVIDYYDDTGTVATLAVILVYIGVNLGEAVEAARLRRLFWVALGLAGTAMLAWALFCTVVPQQGESGVVWMLCVLVWLALGGVVLRVRPRLREWSAEP